MLNTMTWSQCLKLRWKQMDERRWELRLSGITIARIVLERGIYTWSTTNGSFDWHPGLRGAMKAARYNWWIRTENPGRYAPGEGTMPYVAISGPITAALAEAETDRLFEDEEHPKKETPVKTYRTIIAGSRTVEHIALVEYAIAASGFKITEVVSGGAPGADTFGETWAKAHMIPIKRFPAIWNDLSHANAVIKVNNRGQKYDAMAGKRRNQEMADYADQLIAIWDGVSPGTKDMIERGRYLTVFVYDYSKVRL